MLLIYNYITLYHQIIAEKSRTINNKICILSNIRKKIIAVKNMKKHILIISSVVILSTILNVSALSDAAELNKAKKTTENASVEEDKYILKDYNGRIALFFQNETKPIEIYDVFTSSLPESDAKALKDGVSVTDDKLKKILEEYTS